VVVEMVYRTKRLIFAAMSSFSIVIICRNDSHVIGRSLESLLGITDDIVVYDNGSTDGTQEIVKKLGARLYEGKWEGFGATKAKAIALAKYDWILNLDADEAVDDELNNTLKNWVPSSGKIVYTVAFKNFLGERHLKWGEWGSDFHVRLFNRKTVKWDEAPVHENLLMPDDITVQKLKGHIIHRTMEDIQDYSNKMVNYAMLSAEKYFQQGKKASWWKIRLSPGYTFIHYFILKLGFLDGYWGYVSAKMTAWYTFMKYARLRELIKKDGKSESPKAG
jgi:glycosyltransferase involved in cell wall biosynthesis